MLHDSICGLFLQRSLGLSEAQRTEIIQLRRLFLTKMGNITKQRRDIHETMMVRFSPPLHVVGLLLA